MLVIFGNCINENFISSKIIRHPKQQYNLTLCESVLCVRFTLGLTKGNCSHFMTNNMWLGDNFGTNTKTSPTSSLKLFKKLKTWSLILISHELIGRARELHFRFIQSFFPSLKAEYASFFFSKIFHEFHQEVRGGFPNLESIFLVEHVIISNFRTCFLVLDLYAGLFFLKFWCQK